MMIEGELFTSKMVYLGEAIFPLNYAGFRCLIIPLGMS